MKRTVTLLSALLLLPAVADAQSLFGTQGLGVPVPGLDARARGLGVNGVGLLGLSTSMLNPAEPAGILRRGVSAAFQPWGGSVELNDEEGDLSGTRFPMAQVFYPVQRFTFTLGYAGVYDQSWAIVAEGEAVLGGDTLATSDLVRSTGGIGEVKVGAAYIVNERLSVGASVGLYVGNVLRSTTREFEDSLLIPFQRTVGWEYSAPTATFGLRWDPISQVRLGASVQWTGALEAKPDSAGTEHEYDMPLRFNAGISGRITPQLLLAVSTSITTAGSGSFAAPGTATGTIARRTSEFGAGIEWSELRRGDRIFPIRLGVRRAELPFHGQGARFGPGGESAATETVFSGGLGLRLVEDDFGPIAVSDIGFERGKREGWESVTSPDGLRENFWRFTVSLALFGR
ncbi:MAG: hypothetical protein ACT4O1_01930 [Gemmatimonadota bacterium]